MSFICRKAFRSKPGIQRKRLFYKFLVKKWILFLLQKMLFFWLNFSVEYWLKKKKLKFVKKSVIHWESETWVGAVLWWLSHPSVSLFSLMSFSGKKKDEENPHTIVCRRRWLTYQTRDGLSRSVCSPLKDV